MTITPPPGDPVWAHIRLRYEQDQETVATIAADVGLAWRYLIAHGQDFGLDAAWQGKAVPAAPRPTHEA